MANVVSPPPKKKKKKKKKKRNDERDMRESITVGSPPRSPDEAAEAEEWRGLPPARDWTILLRWSWMIASMGMILEGSEVE